MLKKIIAATALTSFFMANLFAGLKPAQIQNISDETKFSVDTVNELEAKLAENGYQSAQFNIPELGGMGQWTRQGGMLQIGEMFNGALKERVRTLILKITKAFESVETTAAGTTAPTASSGCAPAHDQLGQQQGGAFSFPPMTWGAPERPIKGTESLGKARFQGSQNQTRYAYFEGEGLLYKETPDRRVTVYDLAGRKVSGISQGQSSDGGAHIKVDFADGSTSVIQ